MRLLTRTANCKKNTIWRVRTSYLVPLLGEEGSIEASCVLYINPACSMYMNISWLVGKVIPVSYSSVVVAIQTIYWDLRPSGPWALSLSSVPVRMWECDRWEELMSDRSSVQHAKTFGYGNCVTWNGRVSTLKIDLGRRVRKSTFSNARSWEIR
jgi:hypothetical protein